MGILIVILMILIAVFGLIVGTAFGYRRALYKRFGYQQLVTFRRNEWNFKVMMPANEFIEQYEDAIEWSIDKDPVGFSEN